MDAKEFELPIEGSLSKLALLSSIQTEEPKMSFSEIKADKIAANSKKKKLPLKQPKSKK